MRTGVPLACLIAGLALFPAMPAAAQAVVSDTMVPSAEALKPGQFAWYPRYQRASTAGPVKIVVSIPQQLLFAYQDGQLIAVSTVSTGSAGRDTPTGEFTILQKAKFHRSNLYSNAPMPFMQRLTWDGVALHAGHLPGYPASHGCIRLPKAFAEQLFEITAMGASVSVVDDYIDSAPGEPVMPAPMVPAPVLTADASKLGGASFDMVTMQGDNPNVRPASWVTGPAREIVQPIAPGSN